MNTQPRHPKCRALPVEPHPDIHFSVIIPRRGGKSKTFCLWSFLWSKPLLCRFRQPGENPLSPVPQGFAGFCPSRAWIGSTHSQIKRDTNFATPGYSVPAIISRQGGKSKIFLSVVIPVVKAAFVPFSATGKNSLLPVPQGFAAFRLAPSRIQPRHSQMSRPTS